MHVLINWNHSEYPYSFQSIAYNHPETDVNRPGGYQYYLWLQTYKGEGTLLIKDEKIILTKGHGVLIAPFVPHHYFKNTEEWSSSYIAVSGYMSDRINNIIGYEDYFFADDFKGFSFSKHIQTIITENDNRVVDEITDQNKLSVRVYEFILMLRKYVTQDKSIFYPQYGNYILPILKLIRTKYMENLTINDMADSVYISSQYLNKLFNKYFQMPVYKYLSAYRINRAKEMLLTHFNPNLNQICENVGFSDASSFIRTFKQDTGYTPFEYRKVMRQKEGFDI